METLIYFVLGLVMGIAMMQIKIKKLKNENKVLRGVGLIEGQADEKAEHIKKILEFMQGKEKVTNDQIEKLLGVSDRTVQRYFDELVADGKIKRVGETGKGVFYTKA